MPTLTLDDLQPGLFPVADADICGNRHRGNEQSKKAWKEVSPKCPGLRMRIYAWLKTRGKTGATVEEIALKLSLRMTTVSARVSELKRAGLVTYNNETRPTTSGARAGVIVPTGNFA